MAEYHGVINPKPALPNLSLACNKELVVNRRSPIVDIS